MIDSFGDIPSHPLLVHIPVVLVPLSLLATVLMVLLPSLRRRFGSLAIIILSIATAGTFLAARSGRTLEKTYTDAGQTIPDLLQDHSDMGSRLQYLVAIYLVLTIVWIVRARRLGPGSGGEGPLLDQTRLVSIIVVVLVLVAGSFSTLSTLRTGHSGARSVWEQITPD